MWYYKHQKAFRLWRTGNSMSGDCSKQEIGDRIINETWLLMNKDDRMPRVYELVGTKGGICEVKDENGDIIESLSVS